MAGNWRLHMNKMHFGRTKEKELGPHCNKMEGNLLCHNGIYHVEVNVSAS